MGRGIPLPSRLGGLGSVVSSPSGVRGRTQAENDFRRMAKNTSSNSTWHLTETFLPERVPSWDEGNYRRTIAARKYLPERRFGAFRLPACTVMLCVC